MTTDLQYTAPDYVSAQTAWLIQHPFTLIRGFWYPFVIFVAMVILVAYHPERWRNAAIGGLFAVGLTAFSLLITRWRWHRQFNKTPWMQNRVSVTVDGQGIKLKGQSFEAVDYWGTISAIRETDKVFMFLSPNNAFIFFPKQGMPAFQVSEIRSVISSNAKGKVKLAASSAQP